MDHNYENVIKISSQIVLITGGKTHYIRNNAETGRKKLFGRFRAFVGGF